MNHAPPMALVAGLLLMSACSPSPRPEKRDGDDPYADTRRAMVAHQIEARGVRDPAVLQAMRTVPRHRFVPEALRGEAYEDYPLPIGQQQTISQPYIVAAMTELLAVRPGDKVLEVGTGSGYQAGVLARMGVRVFTIEIVESLATSAAERLAVLGYSNVHVRAGDGYAGWPEEAPFDGILVTAGAEHVPPPLVDQLKPGGRMVIPVGPSDDTQWLKLLVREADGSLREQDVMAVRFVPLTGERARGGRP